MANHFLTKLNDVLLRKVCYNLHNVGDNHPKQREARI